MQNLDDMGWFEREEYIFYLAYESFDARQHQYFLQWVKEIRALLLGTVPHVIGPNSVLEEMYHYECLSPVEAAACMGFILDS